MGSILTDQLKGNLKKIVNIRNAFAHYPISFEIVEDASSPELRALILLAGEIVELTQPVCDEYRVLICSIAAALRDVLDNLRSNPKREGHSPLSREGIMWMGHTALTDNTWKVRDANKPLDARDLYLMASRPNLTVNVDIPNGSDHDQEVLEHTTSEAEPTDNTPI